MHNFCGKEVSWVISLHALGRYQKEISECIPTTLPSSSIRPLERRGRTFPEMDSTMRLIDYREKH